MNFNLIIIIDFQYNYLFINFLKITINLKFTQIFFNSKYIYIQIKFFNSIKKKKFLIIILLMDNFLLNLLIHNIHKDHLLYFFQ